MKRKLMGIAIALIALVTGVTVWSATWTSCSVSMKAHAASIVTIGQFTDCACSTPFTAYDWDGVVQGQTYQCVMFVKNTGTEALYITYLPTWAKFDNSQTVFYITVFVVEEGTVCQINKITPIPLPEKDAANCSLGYLLLPGKVIKLDIMMRVDSLVSGGNWAWTFTIFGCAP